VLGKGILEKFLFFLIRYQRNSAYPGLLKSHTSSIFLILLNSPLWKWIAELRPLFLAQGEFAVVEQAGSQQGEEFLLSRFWSM
jgi:hypothetical protein